MTVEIQLTIHFNTPFRVGTGSAGGGIDDVVDRENPLPATHLKGLMRAAARSVLPGRPDGDKYLDQPLTDAVFGTPRHPSPWHWGDAHLSAQPRIEPRVRIKLNAQRIAEPGSLFVGEEMAVAAATATIWLRGSVPSDQLPRHVALLDLSARLVESIGSSRRRGLGWVTVTTSSPSELLQDRIQLVLTPTTTGAEDR